MSKFNLIFSSSSVLLKNEARLGDTVRGIIVELEILFCRDHHLFLQAECIRPLDT